jgi:hypothetical protein
VNQAYEIDATGFLGTFIIFEYTNAIKEARLINFKIAKRFESGNKDSYILLL